MTFHETLDEAKRLWEAGHESEAMHLIMGFVAGHKGAQPNVVPSGGGDSGGNSPPPPGS